MTSKLVLCVFLSLSLSSVVFSADVDDVRAAQEYLVAGEPKKAIKELGDAISDKDLDIVLAKDNNAEEITIISHAETLRGRALLELEQFEESVQAYRRALRADDSLMAAHEGLINALLQLDDWPAVQIATAALVQRTDARPEILLTAFAAALQRSDSVLAINLAELGIMRFPTDQRLRVAHAQAVLQAGDLLRAEALWHDLVTQSPDKTDWWRTLAVVRQQRGDIDGSRDALSVAYHLKPQDSQLAMEYLSSLIQGERGVSALALAKELMSRPAEEVGDPLRYLAVHAAWYAEDVATAKTWLESIAGERDATWQRWQLQIASASEDHAQVLAASDALIAEGHGTPQIRFAAANSAQLMEDFITAEAHLRAVLASENVNHVHLARLHLGRLLIRGERLDEASAILRQAIKQRPGDASAAQLLKIIERAHIAAVQGLRQ